MPCQHRFQHRAAIAQVGQGVAIGELRDAPARGEAEDVGVEQFAIGGIGLEHQLVDVRVLLRIARQPDLHARLQHGAQGLREHAGQTAFGDAAVAEAVRLRFGIGIVAGVERHQRVDAEHQVDVAIQHDRGMHRAAQCTIDDMPDAPALVDQLDRGIQAGQSGAGLHRLRDRHVVPAAVAEAHRLAAVEVDADHVQRPLELAEIVAAPAPAEHIAQEALDLGIVEQAGRHQPADPGHEVRPARITAPEPQVVGEPGGQARDPRGTAQVFQQCRAQEGFRSEGDVLAVAADEDAAQLGGVHAVCQAGGEERAGTDSDVAVQPGQVEAVAGLVQRAQRAQFVHRADRPAAGNGQADAGRGSAGAAGMFGGVQ